MCIDCDFKNSLNLTDFSAQILVEFISFEMKPRLCLLDFDASGVNKTLLIITKMDVSSSISDSVGRFLKWS